AQDGPIVNGDVQSAVTAAFRDEWGKIVATLIRTTGDWDLAEECAQDAFAQALRSWERDGIPSRPGAWLTTVARNRAIDRLRRSSAEAAKLQEAAVLSPPADPAAPSGELRDDRLMLMSPCSHPPPPLHA